MEDLRIPGLTLIRTLGQGGMGHVYLARQEALDRLVALKVIQARHLLDHDARVRFRREARAMAEASHPHLVGLYFFSEDAPQPHLGMEYIPGGTLGEKLKMRQEMSVLAAITLARELLSALEALHGTGQAHRDLKPANIFLRESGAAVLGDLGLVRPSDGVGTLITGSGVVLGTGGYMAPELLEGAPASPSSDLFALGVVLHQVLTGRHPNNSQPFFAPWTASSRDLDAARVPREICHLVLDLLHREPQKRPGSAGEVLERLEGADSLVTAPGRPRLPAPAPAPAPVPRIPQAAGWITASLVVVVLLLVAFPGDPRHPPPPSSAQTRSYRILGAARAGNESVLAISITTSLRILHGSSVTSAAGTTTVLVPFSGERIPIEVLGPDGSLEAISVEAGPAETAAAGVPAPGLALPVSHSARRVRTGSGEVPVGEWLARSSAGALVWLHEEGSAEPAALPELPMETLIEIRRDESPGDRDPRQQALCTLDLFPYLNVPYSGRTPPAGGDAVIESTLAWARDWAGEPPGDRVLPTPVDLDIDALALAARGADGAAAPTLDLQRRIFASVRTVAAPQVDSADIWKHAVTHLRAYARRWSIPLDVRVVWLLPMVREDIPVPGGIDAMIAVRSFLLARVSFPDARFLVHGSYLLSSEDGVLVPRAAAWDHLCFLSQLLEGLRFQQESDLDVGDARIRRLRFIGGDRTVDVLLGEGRRFNGSIPIEEPSLLVTFPGSPPFAPRLQPLAPPRSPSLAFSGMPVIVMRYQPVQTSRTRRVTTSGQPARS